MRLLALFLLLIIVMVLIRRRRSAARRLGRHRRRKRGVMALARSSSPTKEQLAVAKGLLPLWHGPLEFVLQIIGTSLMLSPYVFAIACLWSRANAAASIS